MSKKTDNLTDLEQRRLKKKNATNKQNWADVDKIYNTMAESIVVTMTSVGNRLNEINTSGVFNTPEYKIKKSELIQAVNGIITDSEYFSAQLVKIKEGHKDRKGLITKEEDYALYLTIFNDYNELFNRYQAVVLNQLITITEALTEANLILKNQGETNVE